MQTRSCWLAEAVDWCPIAAKSVRRAIGLDHRLLLFLLFLCSKLPTIREFKKDYLDIASSPRFRDYKKEEKEERDVSERDVSINTIIVNEILRRRGTGIDCYLNHSRTSHDRSSRSIISDSIIERFLHLPCCFECGKISAAKFLASRADMISCPECGWGIHCRKHEDDDCNNWDWSGDKHPRDLCFKYQHANRMQTEYAKIVMSGDWGLKPSYVPDPRQFPVAEKSSFPMTGWKDYFAWRGGFARFPKSLCSFFTMDICQPMIAAYASEIYIKINQLCHSLLGADGLFHSPGQDKTTCHPCHWCCSL